MNKDQKVLLAIPACPDWLVDPVEPDIGASRARWASLARQVRLGTLQCPGLAKKARKAFRDLLARLGPVECRDRHRLQAESRASRVRSGFLDSKEIKEWPAKKANRVQPASLADPSLTVPRTVVWPRF